MKRRIWSIDDEGLICRDGKPVAHLSDCDLERENMTERARASLARRMVRLLNVDESAR